MPAVYSEGHVKHDAESNSVAVRTIFEDNQAWLVATPYRGAYFARPDDVATWDDLYTPPES